MYLFILNDLISFEVTQVTIKCLHWLNRKAAAPILDCASRYFSSVLS